MGNVMRIHLLKNEFLKDGNAKQLTEYDYYLFLLSLSDDELNRFKIKILYNCDCEISHKNISYLFHKNEYKIITSPQLEFDFD